MSSDDGNNMHNANVNTISWFYINSTNSFFFSNDEPKATEITEENSSTARERKKKRKMSRGDKNSPGLALKDLHRRVNFPSHRSARENGEVGRGGGGAGCEGFREFINIRLEFLRGRTFQACTRTCTRINTHALAHTCIYTCKNIYMHLHTHTPT